MQSKDTPLSDERAVEAGQYSQSAHGSSDTQTVGYFEPHQLVKLAQNGRLYVIADSVGAAASGQIASQYAVKKILHFYYTNDNPDLQARLTEAIHQTNADIFERNHEHPQRRLMATAVMAALVHDNKLLVANVGDSRVYVVWDQDIEWLNGPAAKKDETGQADEAKGPILLPAQVAEAKKPSADEPPPSLEDRQPKSLGPNKTVEVEIFTRRLFAGDIVFLASGGLAGYIKEAEIARALTKHSPDQATKRLLALAADRGSRNHISLSVTRVLSSPVAMRSPLPMVMPTAPTWRDWEKPPNPGPPTPDKSATRPLSKPIMPTPSPPLARPPSVEIPLSQPPRRWPGCVMGLLILLLLCVGLILTGRFALQTGALASVPFLSDFEATLTEQAESLGIEIPEIEAPAPETAEVTEPAEPEVAVEPGVANAVEPTVALASTESAAAPATPPVTPATNSNSPIPTPDQVITSTNVTTDTVVVVSTPTATAVALPTVVLPANCESKARFVTDVTVEDGSQFGPQSTFEKVWRVRNEGTCPWGPGFVVRFMSSDYFGTIDEVPLTEIVQPDETLDIAVPMISPVDAAVYRGVWQLHDLDEVPFGPDLFVEIEVTPGGAAAVDDGQSETLFNFIDRALDATWSSGQVTYDLQAVNISDALELPDSGGLVAVGPALLRGNIESEGNALLTHPHQDLGFIQGDYKVDIPVQPGDTLVATLGFAKLSILSDDGVIFEVSFTPDNSDQVVSIISQAVEYRESPISEVFPLTGIEAGQTGTFTLRVLGGDTTSRDFAVWIDLRLVRP